MAQSGGPPSDISDPDSNNKCRKVSLGVLLIGIPIALVVFIGIPLCSVFVWTPMQQWSSSNGVQQCEGNMPILADFDSFLVQEVSVQQLTAHPRDDSFHNLSLYLENTPCSQVPHLENITEYAEDSPPAEIPVYMLKHSSITLQARASTDHVENNPAFFYVLRTVKNFVRFNQRHLSSKDHQIQIKVGRDNKWKLTHFHLPISHNDYYAIKFIVPSSIRLEYNLTMRIRKIDVDTFYYNTTPFATINSADYSQRVEKPIALGSGKHCLFAEIVNSRKVDTHNYTTLATSMSPRLSAGIGVTVTLLVVFFLLIVLLEVIFVLAVKRNRERANERVEGMYGSLNNDEKR